MIDALILKRASTSRLSCVGMPWMWTMLFDYRWPTHGYAASRESAMVAFAKSWRTKKELRIAAIALPASVAAKIERLAVR